MASTAVGSPDSNNISLSSFNQTLVEVGVQSLELALISIGINSILLFTQYTDVSRNEFRPYHKM